MGFHVSLGECSVWGTRGLGLLELMGLETRVLVEQHLASNVYVLCAIHYTCKSAHVYIHTYIYIYIWVVVNILFPFGVLGIIRHLIFRVPQKRTIILTTTHICLHSCRYTVYFTHRYKRV